MARIKASQALVAATWTKLFECTASGGADGEPVREITVRNLEAAGGSTAVIVVVPTHKAADGTPGDNEGFTLVGGAAQPFLHPVPGGGAIRQVWARSAGTPALTWGVTVG